MPAYLLVRLKVTDKARFLEYAQAARGVAAKFGGRYLSSGRPAEVLEGEGRGEPIVLTEWPDADAIRAFWNSPEYQAAMPLRQGAAEVFATILNAEGQPAPLPSAAAGAA